MSGTKILKKLIQTKEADSLKSASRGGEGESLEDLGRILSNQNSDELEFLDSLSDDELRAAVGKFYKARRVVDGTSTVPENLSSWQRARLISTLHEKSAPAIRRYLAAK